MKKKVLRVQYLEWKSYNVRCECPVLWGVKTTSVKRNPGVNTILLEANILDYHAIWYLLALKFELTKLMKAYWLTRVCWYGCWK